MNTDTTEMQPVADGVSQSALIKALSPKWYVHTYVCGTYAGYYEFETKAEAEADYEDRKQRLAICGCSYILSSEADNPRGA